MKANVANLIFDTCFDVIDNQTHMAVLAVPYIKNQKIHKLIHPKSLSSGQNNALPDKKHIHDPNDLHFFKIYWLYRI